MDGIENTTENVDLFNKDIAEKRVSNENTKDLSDDAFNIGFDSAMGSVFGNFGIIDFSKFPNNTTISNIADQVINGVSSRISSLSSSPAEKLEFSGIIDTEEFEKSNANAGLIASTKTEFSKIQDAIESQDEKDPSGKNTGNPDLKNTPIADIKSSDLRDMLDSTLLKFLDETGIKRDPVVSFNDNQILDRGKRVIESVTSKGSNAPAISNPVETGKIESRPRDISKPLDLSIISAPRTIPQSINAPTSIRNNPSSIINRIQSSVTNNLTTNQITTGGNRISVSPNKIEKKVNIENSSAPNSNNTSPVNNNIVSPIDQEIYTNNAEENPILSALGIKSSEISEIFKGGDINTISKTLEESISNNNTEGDIPANVVSNTTQIKTESENKKEQATTKKGFSTMVSEPTKMSQKIEIPVSQSTPAAQQAPSHQNSENSSAGEKSQELAKSPESIEKNDSKGTDKDKTEENDAQNKNSQDMSDLLNVMREILSVLNGPLTVTDGSNRFS